MEIHETTYFYFSDITRNIGLFITKVIFSNTIYFKLLHFITVLVYFYIKICLK